MGEANTSSFSGPELKEEWVTPDVVVIPINDFSSGVSNDDPFSNHIFQRD